MFFIFAILIAQFYRIQITEGEKWSAIGRRQHYFTVREPSLRGIFFSNTLIKRGHPEKPQPFVVDIQKFHLFADPDSIPERNRNEISDTLLALLDLSIDEKKNFRGQFDKKSRSRKLGMWLDRESRDAVNDWWLPYAHQHKIPRNALFFESDYQRSYPFGKLLGQVLHTIQNNKDEKTRQALPTGGLELYFNKFLQGSEGKRRLMRSPRNSFETGEVIQAPENGADIYLTINHVLQTIVEEELAKGVKKAKAKSGWAVMMDPKTGEILALAQYPFFYPPEYQYYFNDKEMIENTKVKAITDAIEPGSIFKPITIALALKANEELKAAGKPPLFSPEEKMSTGNGRFPGRSKPLLDTHYHGFMNMNMAIWKSANIYMARLVERIIEHKGTEWYYNALSHTFALGEKTGIELPAESRGLLPTPGKKHPNGKSEWSTPTPFSLAIGYNIQVNSIQMARVYAVFANGGYLVEPTLVRKIVKQGKDGKEEVLLDHTDPERTAHFPRVLSPDIIRQVKTAMRYVTKTGGTAKRADIHGYTEIGKTSTSKKVVNGLYSETAYRATFCGFAPAENPAFVLQVVLDEPEYGYVAGVGKVHHGGTSSAPIFREIGRRSLEYLGVTPDDPHGYPEGDPRFDAGKANWVAEARLLQEMYEKWNNSSQH